MDGTEPNIPMAPQNTESMSPSQPPTTPEPITPEQMPEASKSSKGLIIGIVIIIILALLGAGGYYYYTNYYKKAAETTPTTTNTSVYTSPTSESTIESDYSNTVAIQPTTEAGKAVNTIFQPILQKVFTNVKLKEQFGTMMTYVVNRKITAADVAAVQTGVNAVGYKTIDSSAKQLTVSKGAYTWVITFAVDNENKAIINITF